ncbi:MAG: hypothetical protein K2R98_21985 [Gemmataceae bacterium]|nr:hypothetical protein [Gemmataceae bacterium]
MPVVINCPSCKATLRAPDEWAGKKTRCPKCKSVIDVPAIKKKPPEEDFEEVEVVEEPEEKAKPASAAGDPFDFDGSAEEPKPKRKGKAAPKVREEEEEEEEEERRPKKKGKYKPCPQCDSGGAKRVKYTMWGSFYGPILFTHVRCPECGYCYNGKTGRSNLVPAILFVTIPAILIVALLIFIVVTLEQKGVIQKFW